METERKTCCFFGHRKITEDNSFKAKLYEVIESLIVHDNIDTFLFGSKSEFNSLCKEIVCELKEKHTHIRRIYVRAEYPDISDDYEKYLLQSYDETYFPPNIRNAGKAVYIERNFEMIDKSDICVVYYMGSYNHSSSGTDISYQYAVRKKRRIINTHLHNPWN